MPQALLSCVCKRHAVLRRRLQMTDKRKRKAAKSKPTSILDDAAILEAAAAEAAEAPAVASAAEAGLSRHARRRLRAKVVKPEELTKQQAKQLVAREQRGEIHLDTQRQKLADAHRFLDKKRKSWSRSGVAAADDNGGNAKRARFNA